MSKYRIKNWDRFQHYRQRNPPWIKLHYDLLSSSDWVMLDDASRVLAVACMLVASRFNGEIDGSEAGLAYLKRVAYLHKPPNLKPLIVCGFLVIASIQTGDASMKTQDASASVSEYMSSLSVSSLSVSEEGGVGETKQTVKKSIKIPHGEFLNVLLTQEEFVKLGQRFGNGLSGRIENLSQYLASKGDKYKSHYATILQWASRDAKGATNGSRSDHPQSSRNHQATPGKYAHLGQEFNPDRED